MILKCKMCGGDLILEEEKRSLNVNIAVHSKPYRAQIMRRRRIYSIGLIVCV